MVVVKTTMTNHGTTYNYHGTPWLQNMLPYSFPLWHHGKPRYTIFILWYTTVLQWYTIVIFHGVCYAPPHFFNFWFKWAIFVQYLLRSDKRGRGIAQPPKYGTVWRWSRRHQVPAWRSTVCWRVWRTSPVFQTDDFTDRRSSAQRRPPASGTSTPRRYFSYTVSSSASTSGAGVGWETDLPRFWKWGFIGDMSP